MPEKFYVKEISLEQWNVHWQQVLKANLLQSWQYGAAKEKAEGWRALRFLISDNSEHPVALAQILARSLPLLGGIARLNRGPLLLDELPEDQSIARYLEALRALLTEAQRRRWWVVQIAPELPDTEKVFNSLTQMGLRPRPEQAWASGRLALGVDEKSLMTGLKRRWRRNLEKASRLGVEVTHKQISDAETDLFINRYKTFQRMNDFEGIPEALIRSLAQQHGPAWQFDMFVARVANEPVTDLPLGMLASIRHGDTSTGLVSYTNDRGRQMLAFAALLWQAILHAKEAGCSWFDIGGLSAATPKGIAEFKEGVNAEPYALVGEWRLYNLPWSRLRKSEFLHVWDKK